VWRKLLGVDRATAIKSIDFDEGRDPEDRQVPHAGVVSVGGGKDVGALVDEDGTTCVDPMPPPLKPITIGPRRQRVH
jgi:hypothetical protein